MRARRIVTGLILMLAGIIFTLVSAYIVQAAQDQQRISEQTYQKSDSACRELTQKLGAIKESREGALWELNVPVVADTRDSLNSASVAIAACPTRSMEYFCLGSGCSDPEGRSARPLQRRPVSMTMRLALRPGFVAGAEPVKTAAPAAIRLPGSQPAQPAARPPTPQQPARPAPPPAAGLKGMPGVTGQGIPEGLQ